MQIMPQPVAVTAVPMEPNTSKVMLFQMLQIDII